MTEIVAAHLERVAQELVDSWRKDSGKIVRWERLEADVAAALAACAREAKATGFIAGWLAANPNETLAEGRAKYIESLERAAGEKGGCENEILD